MLLIEREAPTTNEAHLSELTRNDSGMSRASAGRGQDSIRYRISGNVLGRGIRSRQDRWLSAIDKVLGLRAIEGDAPAGDSGRGGDCSCDRLSGAGESSNAQMAEIDIGETRERLPYINRTLTHQIDGDTEGGAGVRLAVRVCKK